MDEVMKGMLRYEPSALAVEQAKRKLVVE